MKKRNKAAIWLNAICTLGIAMTPAVLQSKPLVPQPKLAALSARGDFYVGGRNIPLNGSVSRVEAMYVQYFIPSKRTKKYPIILVHGNYQNGTAFLSTPDGRQGWAETLLRQGYAVYVVDQPMRGRSPYNPANDGPASTLSAGQIEKMFTAPELTSPIPQAKLHTQWPGSGRQGDAAFDQLFASQQPTVNGPNQRIDRVVRDALSALLGKIGPSIVLTHSRAGTFGWEAADDNPNLVKAVVAIEPNGPPFFDPTPAKGEDAEKPARPWGITYDRLRVEPAITSSEKLTMVQQGTADGKDLHKCWLQADQSPRQLPNLKSVPVMIVTGEASYHAPYDHCTARFLDQAGVSVSFTRLENIGIKGNGHLMMLEKNSDQIVKVIAKWLDDYVH